MATMPTEMVDSNKKYQEEFSKAVHRYFEQLTGVGMEPNEACALSLKIAAGMADPPTSVETLLRIIEVTRDSEQYDDLLVHIDKFFGNPESLHAAFWLRAPEASDPCKSGPRNLQIDFEGMGELYNALQGLKNREVLDALSAACDAMAGFIATSNIVSNPGLNRQIAIMLANPILNEIEYHSVASHVANSIVNLGREPQSQLVEMFCSYNKQDFHQLIVTLQQYITITLYQQQTITQGVEDATKLLALLSEANSRSSLVNFTEFYNDAVNNEDFNIKEDFRRWKNPHKYDFSFCKYPFVYDPASKARILQVENQLAQMGEFNNVLLKGMMSGSSHMDMCPFLVLKVRRGPHLVQDTLIQINRAKEHEALKKPLKVKFIGEEGVDEGGVQKEFFQLLVRELFNVEYGMFTYDEATRLYWFRPSHLDMDMEFELIGILIGLAIYNSHILEFSFPMVLYKKLMGGKPLFDDLRELHPDVHQNLKKLLEYEGCVDDFGLCFQVECEVGFGERETVDLMPGGDSIAVTAANRVEYVSLYTRHLLDTSVRSQFLPFQRGFLRLCSGSALSWFRPEELELLICGGRELDLDALEAHTLYDDGFTADSQVVRWFWEVVNALTQAQKKRLLFFVTGSDRVPIKGLAHLNPPLVISRNGPHSERLPTAHTCFNHLLLPQYDDRETLRSRLELAIENAEGFGLM